MILLLLLMACSLGRSGTSVLACPLVDVESDSWCADPPALWTGEGFGLRINWEASRSFCILRLSFAASCLSASNQVSLPTTTSPTIQGARNKVSEEASPHLLHEAKDQRLGAEQYQLPCGSTGTSGSCQEAGTCMVQACHTPRQPLQDHPSGHLGW